MSHLVIYGKYRKVHAAIMLINVLGLFLIAVAIARLLNYFSDSILAVYLSFFVIFYWFTLLYKLEIYLTGEYPFQYMGQIFVQKTKKKEKTVWEVAYNSSKFPFVSALIMTLVYQLINIYR